MNSIIILLITYVWSINAADPERKVFHPIGAERQMAVIAKTEGLYYLSKFLRDPEKWDLAVEGFSPAYYDKVREAIAVNTVEQPTDQWAAATTLFEQPSGVYNIRFTSLLESDGECTFILKIGGKKVLDFQNPKIYGEAIEEYAPYEKEVNNVSVEHGSMIRVEFLPHSNGLVPEGDGFGFARARWKSNIEFIPLKEE
jgi:hypothetical protein